MSYQMLKPGGKMVYSTCSFSYEEDEEVIDYLLSNSDAQIEEINDSSFFFKKGNGVHLFPSLFPGEGHYICLIKKPGELKVSKKENKVSTKYKIATPYTYIEKFGDYLYTMSEMVNTKKLNIIRYGVKVGELIKQDIKFDHHYAHFVDTFESVKEIPFDELLKYYQGECLYSNVPKGDILLKYRGINVDIAKSDGRIIKNHLPKGLRRKYNF